MSAPPVGGPKVTPVPSGLPVVALVGRPNVGKSALFNRLVGARRAIVDDAPGVTRDRLEAVATCGERRFLCVDTGGFLAEAPVDPKAMGALVRGQALAAIGEADVIVCVFDAAAGFLPVDRETARLLERSGKPVVWVVNKVDGPKREDLLHDFWSAGVAALLPTSAAHGLGIGELREAIASALPPAVGDSATAAEGIRLSLLGRPNVGKSSLLNRLLGQERTIVTPVAGTTRDAIDTAVTVDGEPWVLIDTAGIRRRMRVEDPLERHGAVRALSALERTDVALVVLDATEGMTDQDARIVARAWDAGRGVVLLANKWDLLPPGGRDASAFRKALAVHRPAFADLPLLCVSARTGDGLAGLFPLVRRVAAAHQRTIPTAALNRALAEAVEANPPPNPKGRPVRLYYATQTGTRPPELTIFTNSTAPPPAAYARFVTNRLLAAFELIGVPLRIRYRARPRAGVSGAPGPDSARRTRRTKPPARAPKRSRRR